MNDEIEEEVKKYPTFIRGFDETLEGGVPQGHSILVTGTPGTMKSSLTYSILYNNAKYNGTMGVYMNLEQNRKSFLYQLKRLGMSGSPQNKLGVLDLGIIRKNMNQFKGKTWMELFKMYVSNLKENLKYDLLVVDSLVVLELLARFQEPREELFSLFEWFKDLDVTVFFVSEMSLDSKEYAKYDEDFLCDGIVHLTMDKVSEIDVQRRIRCVKMRGVDHSTSYFTLLFKDGNFQVTRTISD